MEETLIFKAYSRKLLRHLEAVKEAMAINEHDKAKTLLNELIQDVKEDA